MPAVTIRQFGVTLDIPADRVILEAALDAGLNYPFGCHSGTCGACKSRLIAGRVTMAEHSPQWPVQAGEVVSTGTITDAWPMAPGQVWRSRPDHAALPGLTLRTTA